MKAELQDSFIIANNIKETRETSKDRGSFLKKTHTQCMYRFISIYV